MEEICPIVHTMVNTDALGLTGHNKSSVTSYNGIKIKVWDRKGYSEGTVQQGDFIITQKHLPSSFRSNTSWNFKGYSIWYFQHLK